MNNLKKIINSALLELDEFKDRDGNLLKDKVVQSVISNEETLLKKIFSKKELKKEFFQNNGDFFVFKKEQFLDFFQLKNYLSDSYTSFRKEIGLSNSKNDFLKSNQNVVLNFPYKDCLFVGDNNLDDKKSKNEVFYNNILASDQISKLLEPVIFYNTKYYSQNSVRELEKMDLLNLNYLIKGNNLFALNSLLNVFEKKIKTIFIDPPFNIGGDDFEYNDRFKHSTWLVFMKNRLEIAFKLLKNDGTIFIYIDKNEFFHLKVLCDEIFGRENFIQMITVKSSSTAGFKSFNLGTVEVCEYILVYGKDIKKTKFNDLSVKTNYDENYNLFIENISENPSKWKINKIRDHILKLENIENTKKELEKKFGTEYKNILLNKISDFAFNNADKIVSIRDPQKPAKKLAELLIESKHKKNKDKVLTYEKQDGSRGYVLNGGLLSFFKNKIKEIDGKLEVTDKLSNLWTDISWDGIAREGNVKLKNGKKPEKLIKRILELTIHNKEKDIVMDFFLGCGTTAAVAHKMGIRYIGIEQLNYGENDSLERLKNVVNGDETGISKIVNWKNGGSFCYFEILEKNYSELKKIFNLNDKQKLIELFNTLKDYPYIDYRLNLSNLDKSKFDDLSIKELKKIIFDLLDKSFLYESFYNLEDENIKISNKEKDINKFFYNNLKDNINV